MKYLKAILNHKIGEQMAGAMEIICYVVVGLLVAILVFACMGRLEYDLRTGVGQYPEAIYAEENHEYITREFRVSNTNDHVYVHTSGGAETVQLTTYAVIVILFAISILPILGIAFLLAHLFRNIARGDTFVLDNAYYLVMASGIKVIVALIIPFVKLGIVDVADKFLVDNIALATGGHVLEELMMAMVFFMAAYVIYSGRALQQIESENER